MNAITRKGQVTIPKAVRDALGIGPGSQVDFVMNDKGEIVLRKADNGAAVAPRFDRVRGSLKSDMTTDEIMALLRGDD